MTNQSDQKSNTTSGTVGEKIVMTTNVLGRLINNVFAWGASRFLAGRRSSPDRRRDVREEVGVPSQEEMDAEFFDTLNKNSSFAQRINEVYAIECWQVCPEVYENEEIIASTPPQTPTPASKGNDVTSPKPASLPVLPPSPSNNSFPLPKISEPAPAVDGTGTLPTPAKPPKREAVTPFEKALRELDKSLRGKSWSAKRPDAEHEGSYIFHILKKADIISGRGRYGVIFLGFDDVKNLAGLAKPVQFVEYEDDTEGGTKDKLSTNLALPYSGSAKSTPPKGTGNDPIPTAKVGSSDEALKRKLLFVRVLPETLARVSRYDSDMSSPRYGLPLEYEITLNDVTRTGIDGQMEQTEATVHWSRILHVADNTNDASPIFGEERCRSLIMEIMGLEKLVGGSPEMYWQAAIPAISIETNPNLVPGEIEMDKEEMKDQFERFLNHLQRYFTLEGMSAKILSPTVVDPTPFIERLIEAICIKMGIPKRIFMGSERGELSSSQDDAAWNDRKKERHLNYLSPCLVCPFFDRLILAGVLPQPKQYYVCWPDLTSQTAQEKSAVVFQLTQAITQFVGGNGADLIPPVDYLARLLGPACGFGEEAAKLMYAEAKKAADERKAVEQQQALEQAEVDFERQMKLKPPMGPNGPPSKRPPGMAGGGSGDGGGRGPSQTRRPV